MKTTVHDSIPEPMAPVEKFPALYLYTEGASPYHGEVALFRSDGSGVVLNGVGPSYPTGHEYEKYYGRFSEWDFQESWTRLTAPITITFDPTK